MGVNEVILEVLKKKDVKFLCNQLFNFNPSFYQQYIIKRIAFSEKKRLSISAYTRYGKTKCVAIAVAIFILINEKKKIALIGPQREQAELLRNYLVDAIISCKFLFDMLKEDKEGFRKMGKEVSKNRVTFINGCEYRVFSAYHDANRLMGFGADLIIVDEACLITVRAYAKIMRMLGDDPEHSILVELYNPWDRATRAFEHSIDPDFEMIRVGWMIGIKEGRTTENFVKEQRKELTPLEFTVLYESHFPEESEDSIFNLARVKEATSKKFNLLDKLSKLLEKKKDIQKMTEKEAKELKESIGKFKRIISCDVADKGLDKTVIYDGLCEENKFELVWNYSEAKSENTAISGRIIGMLNNNKYLQIITNVNIDTIGIGTGVVSMVKEYVLKHQLRNVVVNGCHFGEKAIKDMRFSNKKAENYFRLKDLFDEELISIPDSKDLIKDLIAMKWELNSTGKIKIIDPDKSPDFSDSLVYFVWKDTNSLIFAFG